MKTALQSFGRAVRLVPVGLMAILLGSLKAIAFPIITNVVEINGDNEATDTIVAQWTGVTWNTTIANEPTLNTPVGTPFTVPTFSNTVATFVDRNHRYVDASAILPIPGYLVGAEYIMSGNDNRDNNPPALPAYQLDISVSEPAIIFMLVDNRLSNDSNANPPNFAEGIDPTSWTVAMTWLGVEGYKPLLNGLNRTTNVTWPDEVGIDEGSDGTINNWYSIYWKQVPAGTTSIYQADNGGRNMYGVVVGRPVGPLPPGNLQAASMNARVSLTWSASTGAASYVVKRSDISGGPYLPIVTNATTGYLDTNVVNFQTYYYVVSSVGFFAEGSNSVQVAATPKLAPENLVAISGTNQVSLSWTALSGASSYTVKRSDASGGPYSNLVAGLTTTSHVDGGLPSGRRFYYTVSASLTAGGESANADEAQGLTAPNTPANFGLELFGSTGAKLRWTTADVVDPTNLIERSSDGVNFVSVGVSTGAARVYVDPGLARSATYHYRIRATNSGGFSSYTSLASLTTPVYGININFANNVNADGGTTNLAPTPVGYVQDIGEIFGPHGSFSFGWDVDNTVNGRWRQSPQSSDLRYDTLNHMQRLVGNATWEIELTNGLYLVHFVAGDPTATDSIYQFTIEGFLTRTVVPTTGNWWAEFTNTVRVTDDRLTITSGPAANNNKISYVDIYPIVDTTPPVLLSAARNSACAGDSLTVVFNEVLTASSAIEAANYRVVNVTAGVSFGVAAGSPVLREDGQTVALTSSAPLTNGTVYQVIATNVQDVALNASVQGSAPVALKGSLVPASVGADWLLSAEAESPDAITPRVWRNAERTWVPTTTRAGYSGTGAMRALPNTEGDPRPADASECASLDFCVHFPESDTYPRTYYIWVRGGADGGADDSCFVGLDGPINGQNLNQGWVVPGYIWSGVDSGQLRVSVDIPSGGFHTIHVFLREDGFYCDKIVLTTDVNYTPASVNGGLGPDASSREAAMPPPFQFVPGTPRYAGGAFSANLQTIANLTNVVEYKNSLSDSAWTPLTSFTGNGAIVPITDPGPLPTNRFYRARAVIP